jgi:alpha-D-ribose 1-methylphosphonate 5-triphosphate synthase subunit PhnH
MTGTAIINDGTATIKNNEGDKTSTYNGTIYTNSTKTVTIEGNKFYDKLNTTINISTDNAYPAIGDVINITFTLKDQLDRPIIDENITITIKDYTANKTTDITGTTSIEHTIKSNETLITATYPGNNNYNTNTTTLLVTAPKIETKLIVDDTDTKVGQNFTITGTLLDKDNQPLPEETVNITVNGTTNTATTNNLGKFNTTFTLEQMGEYPIIVIYPGTDVYNQSTNSTAKVTATKTDTKLTLNVSNTTVVNNTVVTITANLTDTNNNPLINQPVTITIGEETFKLNTNENGIINKEYTTHEVGKQNITVTYNGNNMYNANSTTTNINVYKIDTKLTLNVSNTTAVNNTQINITAILTDTDGNKLANQNITLNVAGKPFNIKTNSNGVATQNYTPTTLGKQTITATYNGDSQHNNSPEQTTTINIIKIDTKLSVKVSNSTPINNTNITITATLTDTDNKAIANQNITLNVAGKTFNVKTNSNGIATQNYTPTTIGTQTITANYKGDSQYVNSNATTNITVKKINTKIDLKVSNNTPINNTPINITVTLTDADNNKLSNQQVTLNINGKTATAKTNNNGQVTQTYTPTKVETQNITATYNGDSRYNNSTKTIRITVKNKIKTQTTVTPVTGVIGEKLTIKATVTDTNGNNVNEGNLIFKVNGVTIKDNGKLTGSSNPLKIKVVNGVATATIIPDINMTNAKNITAYYVGTTIYNASTSNPASMNISKRNATIEVTTNKKITKQGQILTITAKIYDTTNGKKTSNITQYQDEYVYFKVNGITLKDANGEMLKVKIINGTATVNYTIPLGISCVTDMQTLTPKNHTIQVGLYNKNYQNIMTKTPTFQVERSNITINLANATINNKTHTLSMKITIKDYLKNTVAGPNKLVIKVNGLTLKNGTNVQYYYTTDGVLNLKNIPIPTAKNYTSIEVITQDRLAYNSQRNTTKVIKITN